MTSIRGEATTPEKASIYQGLGLNLVYQPDHKLPNQVPHLQRSRTRCGRSMPANT